MKVAILSAAALLSVLTAAYPPWLMERGVSETETLKLAQIAARVEARVLQSKEERMLPGFDAESQYVSNKDDHAFVAPGLNDLRGPCPALNAMSNHGYLPSNGVATIDQFIEGTYDVFGMGIDLGTFLSIYGAVLDGDLTKWSIGGPPHSGLLSGIGLLGKPQGISKSHNNYEGDASPTRGDFYQYGEAALVQVPQFKELFNLPLGEKGYDIPTLTGFRASRFQQSIDNNPHFFNAPFSGVAASAAAYTFMYRFMSNKSEEHPDGYLDGDTLKSFFSITGEPSSFVYKAGNERIPDNWYKRAIGDEYGLALLATDIADAALEHPQFLSVGGNTGEVDTFTGVDIEQLTDGAYNSKSLLEGNNLACFTFQASQAAAPDILKGLFGSVTKPLAQLNNAVDNAISALSCPQFSKLDTSQLYQFPGGKGAY